MKILLILSVLLISGCYQEYSQNSEEVTNVIQHDEVTQAVSKALANNDYRFYATQGRRTTFPGLDESIDADLIERCRHQFMPGTGDVFKSQEERLTREKNIEYASRYNVLMKSACAKNL